jgi:phosphoenolpyruvate-protein kinase (PTS system EI component)
MTEHLDLRALAARGAARSPGALVGVDGSTGEVVVARAPDVLGAVQARDQAALAATRWVAPRPLPSPQTAEASCSVQNVDSVADAATGAAARADLAGLERTEFLLLDRSIKQYAACPPAMPRSWPEPPHGYDRRRSLLHHHML